MKKKFCNLLTLVCLATYLRLTHGRFHIEDHRTRLYNTVDRYEDTHQIGRRLHVVEYPFGEQPLDASRELDPSLDYTLGKDIPLDALQHTGSEFEPDQVRISMWTETAMLFSWATGHGRVFPWHQGHKAMHGVGNNRTCDCCGDAMKGYDPKKVESIVEIDMVELEQNTAKDGGSQDHHRGGHSVVPTVVDTKRVVYNYTYGPQNGAYGTAFTGESDHAGDREVQDDVQPQETQHVPMGTLYHSPILHHVLVDNLLPGQTYTYRVGNNKHGWSKRYQFTMPKNRNAYPFTIGVVADLGQTHNSSKTLERMIAAKPDVAILAGDLSYADAYFSNGSYYFWTATDADTFRSFQPRWDTFGRLLEQLAAFVPFATIGGNHELESMTSQDNVTNVAYNARYPNPQYPEEGIQTSPNDPLAYWDFSLLPHSAMFLPDHMSNAVKTNNTFYSINTGPVHMIFLNNYVPYGKGSVMYEWLKQDLKHVDRRLQPWIVVVFHTPFYSTYMGSYKENAEMQHHVESLLVENHVDLVISGHIHAYERSVPTIYHAPNSCGPIHIVVGCGGNSEGMTSGYIDKIEKTYSGVSVSDLCENPDKYYATPGYQPTYSGRGYVDHSTPFCYTSQAPWSDYRDPSFGFGQIVVLSEDTMEWKWQRNVDACDIFSDHVIVRKRPVGAACSEKVVEGSQNAAHAGAVPWKQSAKTSIWQYVLSYAVKAMDTFHNHFLI